MCRVLTVSRSGYYDWRGRPPSERAQANIRLVADVHRVYAEHKSRAGAPRITKQLRDEGQTVGKHRVARVMRAESLRANTRRRPTPTTACRWPRTCFNRTSRPRPRTRNG